MKIADNGPEVSQWILDNIDSLEWLFDNTNQVVIYTGIFYHEETKDYRNEPEEGWDSWNGEMDG